MIKIIDLSKDRDKGIRTIEATFMVDGELVPLKVSEQDRQDAYNGIIKLLETPDLDISDTANELYALMSPVVKVKKEIENSLYLSNNLSLHGGVLKFGDFILEKALSSHMLSLLDESNVPKDERLWKSYVTFLDNLHQNVDEDIRKQLFRWMEYENEAGNGFGITEDGCIIGYRGCQGTILNPESVHSGTAIVDGVEITGRIPNKVGSTIKMPRSAVQYDPQVGCSTGLHVGTRNYAVSWAPILLLVKVNPRDVVSVPYECDSQKMRVCEYTILKVTDASEEHMRFYPEYDNCDYDYDDYYEDDCYDDDYDEEYYEYDCYDDDNEDDEENNELSTDKAMELFNKLLSVKYDDKEFEGIIVDVFIDGKNSGIIMKNENSEYKHIKLNRIANWNIIEEDEETEDEETEDNWLIDKDVIIAMKHKAVYVEYDSNKKCKGVVIEIYDNDEDPGIIIKTQDNGYKHIKLDRINYIESKPISDEDFTSFLQFIKKATGSNDEIKEIKSFFEFLGQLEDEMQ